jgi:hypothetical protein
VKCCLRGQTFETSDDPVLSIEAVWASFQKSTLDELFGWTQILQQCLATNGNHFEEV